MLGDIGIVRGQAFSPDARIKRILDESARVASFTMATMAAKPRREARRSPDRQWLELTNFNYPFFIVKQDHRLDGDAMSTLSWFGTGVTPAMLLVKAGAGSNYLWSYVDRDGKPLDGSKTYRVRMPKDVPAADFWSFTVYDVWTRSMLEAGPRFPSKNSFDKKIRQEADGSTDIYFGPSAPKGFEQNWIKTAPGKGWFTMFRVYGPTQDWIDKRWTLGDVELVPTPAAR